LEVGKNKGAEALINFQIGQIVFSKQGRDKGMPFVVLDIQDEYLYLADGKYRLIAKPKKKKLKHVQPTNTVNESVASGIRLLDSDLRKAIAGFKGK